MNITSLADEYNFIFWGSWGGFSPYLYRGREIRLSRSSEVISEQNQTDYERIVNGL